MGKYPTDWFELTIGAGSTLERPGIYLWSIDDTTSYVGRYSKKSRPLGEYPRNVFRIREGIPYRPQDPDGFRAIHHHLAAAADEGRAIKLTILENCDAGELNQRERFYREQIPTTKSLNGLKRNR
ncbi:MAG: hypothetical protein ACKOPM_08650 [Novosphingobium sp.]